MLSTFPSTVAPGSSSDIDTKSTLSSSTSMPSAISDISSSTSQTTPFSTGSLRTSSLKTSLVTEVSFSACESDESTRLLSLPLISRTTSTYVLFSTTRQDISGSPLLSSITSVRLAIRNNYGASYFYHSLQHWLRHKRFLGC